MRKAFSFLFGFICATTYMVSVTAQQSALQTAATTLGVANIKTLQFTGSGRNFSVGQNYTTSDPWPAVSVPGIHGDHELRHREHAGRVRARDG